MLTETAQGILDGLLDPDAPDDAAVALAVPFGLPQAERALLIDHFGEIVGELRRHGYEVAIDITRTDVGEFYALSLADDDQAGL